MRTLKGDHRLTGVDRCARGEVERVLVVQLVDAFEDTQAGADGALGIVAVGDRRPEDRHDRVADFSNMPPWCSILCFASE